jgi:magnesium transporter
MTDKSSDTPGSALSNSNKVKPTSETKEKAPLAGRIDRASIVPPIAQISNSQCHLFLTSVCDDVLKEHRIDLDGDSEQSEQFESDQLRKLLAGTSRLMWLHIVGKPSPVILDQIKEIFGISQIPSAEDFKGHSRSTFEQSDDQVSLVAWSASLNKGFHMHQMMIIASSKFVLTMQPAMQRAIQGELVDSTLWIREKLRKQPNRLAKASNGYLVHELLSYIVDSYFPCLERYGERLDAAEDEIINRPTKSSISRIHAIKRELIMMRRHIWSLREALNSLLRDASDLFETEALVGMRNVYDHSVQLIDVVETYREMGADLMDVYLSSISNRMNEVMKVLTIITTIFVPPGLVAAIYGMNFRQDKSPFNMPELSWYLGYPFALTLMALLASVTVSFFWMQGWLGDKPKFMQRGNKKNI